MSSSGEDGTLPDYKGGCKRCGEIEKEYVRSSQENVFIIHTTRSVVKANKKNDQKRITLQRIVKVVSALRNTEGGVLLVHIEGQLEDDRCLEYFDELISKRLHDIIENGQPYVDVYKRFCLSSIKTSHYQDFVTLEVQKSSGPATVDFNTKLRTDNENTSPLTQDIKGVLSRAKTRISSPAEIRGLQTDFQCLQEHRGIELKAFKPSQNDIERSSSNVVTYIRENLNFKDNLTALSKVPEGGSYYVGVAELKRYHCDYETKCPYIEGFELKVKSDDVIRKLQEKIASSTVAYDRQLGFIKTPEDLVKITFHLLPGRKSERYVLEVAVRYFDGIVFSDAEGPRAYRIQDGKIKRINK